MSPFFLFVLKGCGNIALYGPICVTAVCFHDGPSCSAVESPHSGWCRNGERTLHTIENQLVDYLLLIIILIKLGCKLKILQTMDIICMFLSVLAVYGHKHGFARSIYPTVRTHADSSGSCGGEQLCVCKTFIFISNKREVNILCLAFVPGK